MKLTKSFIDKVQLPVDKDQVFYRDELLKNFALRVTAKGSKSFVLEKSINNKIHRITIGRYGDLTVEEARKQAQVLLGQIAKGIDPHTEKQVNKMRGISLKEVLEDYIKARKTLKPKTAHNYSLILANAFGSWCNKPITSITKDKIAQRHEVLGKENGQAYANLAMRILRALFNFAASQYEDAQGRSLIAENPTKRLTQTRAWYRIKRRETYIRSHELASWHQAVQEVENTTIRDYLLLILFTGLRREEAASLKWEQVDLKERLLKVIDTKNYEVHTLPLSTYLHKLFLSRRSEISGAYVFPGPGVNGYIVEMRKQMAKITEKSGVQFTIHDLRRTFITIAEGLDIAAYALKRLLNHKMNNDVTSGYIITDVERLRRPMQLVTDYLLKKCVEDEVVEEQVGLSVT